MNRLSKFFVLVILLGVVVFKLHAQNVLKSDVQRNVLVSHNNLEFEVSKNYKSDLLSALRKAGKNSIELINALKQVKKEYLQAMCFLISNMPERDLRSLEASYLVENVELAYKAKKTLPWGAKISKKMFFNYVLPYCVVNERRDNWRQDFYKKFIGVVKDCNNTGDAAKTLNREMWDMIDVKYSRARPKPDQSPYESIRAKKASCTGLSVLLIDACRALCIPARFVGIPKWPHKRGNHSWVEVWANGQWNVLGAFETSPLNETWFMRDAAKADKTKLLNSVYAVSFENRNLKFPCIWNKNIDYISAVNVTDFYNKFAKNLNIEKMKCRFLIMVVDVSDKRIRRNVAIYKDGKRLFEGKSASELQDYNDILEFHLLKKQKYEIRIDGGSKTVSKLVTVTDKAVENYKIVLD